MRAINHAMTGTVIGLAIANPVALPLAVVSHFICDMIPHYGPKDNFEDTGASRAFELSLIVDALLCAGLVGFLAVQQPAHWQLAAICAFLAAAPDFLWINKFIVISRGKTYKPSAFSKFAKDIQWFERPIGAIFEVIWFVIMAILLSRYL